MNGRAHCHLKENLKFGKKALKQISWIWTMTYLSQAYLNTIIKQFVKSIRTSYRLSTLFKRALLEKIELEYELNTIAAYEKEKANGTLELFDVEEVMDELRVEM